MLYAEKWRQEVRLRDTYSPRLSTLRVRYKSPKWEVAANRACAGSINSRIMCIRGGGRGTAPPPAQNKCDHDHRFRSQILQKQDVP